MENYYVGKLVEVRSKAQGFVGSYYEAKLVNFTEKEGKYLVVVEYTTLFKKEDGQDPLTEIVDSSEIRPVPPPIKVRKFDKFDKVDAYHNDGWWVGTITGEEDDGVGGCNNYYYVYFPVYGVELKYHVSNLRLHQKYKQRRWFHCPRPQNCIPV